MKLSVLALTGLSATTPEVGPGELLDYVPILYQLALFLIASLSVILVGWFIVEPLLSRVVRGRNPNNPTIQDVVTRYLRLVIVCVALLIGVAAAGFGYIIGDSLLVIAAGTLAVGVAGQTVLGSLVSGIVLVTDPEFNVGDYIEWDDGRGRVQSITLRVTRVITPSGELLTVPNTVLTDGPIRRPYAQVRYRLLHRIGISYDDDPSEAMAILQEVAEDHPDIADEPSPKAYVEDFESDWVALRLQYWIADPERQEELRIRSAVATALKDDLEAAGITISPASKRDLEGEVAVADPAE
ncbi:MAG: mechanosensitive ion channel family protein [Salinirussus sp.]